MLSLQSPAKINLFLRILKKRSDGYHEIASLLQAIDLCDTLHFTLAEKDVLTCSDKTLPIDHTNLISKAVKLFRNKVGIKQKFVIHLEKKIPQKAGLGGGSSNAATTLWALNLLCGKLVGESQLAEWGAEIGSDISFFLSQGTAYCTGRGEILQPVPPLKKQDLWIIKPIEGLSTKLVYAKLDASMLFQSCPEKALDSFLKGSSSHYFNDLEIPAFEVLPSLALLKKKLWDCGFSDVLMSGSGSSFFCFGEGDLSSLRNCLTFKTQFIQRKLDCWY